jgi:hypothetical protein
MVERRFVLYNPVSNCTVSTRKTADFKWGAGVSFKARRARHPRPAACAKFRRKPAFTWMRLNLAASSPGKDTKRHPAGYISSKPQPRLASQPPALKVIWPGARWNGYFHPPKWSAISPSSCPPCWTANRRKNMLLNMPAPKSARIPSGHYPVGLNCNYLDKVIFPIPLAPFPGRGN